MKNDKKGLYLGKVTLGVLIAVIVLVLLITLGSKLFWWYSDNQDKVRLDDNLNLLYEKIEYLKSPAYTENVLEVGIFLPTGVWYMASFPEGYFPENECVGKFESCFCFCLENNCRGLKSCKGSEFKLGFGETRLVDDYGSSVLSNRELDGAVDKLFIMEKGENVVISTIYEEGVFKRVFDLDVEYKGKEQKLIEVVNESLRLYFETENSRGQSWAYMSGYKIHEIRLSAAGNYLFTQEDAAKLDQNNQEVANVLTSVLKDNCEAGFVLNIPQGLITNAGGIKDGDYDYLFYKDYQDGIWGVAVAYPIRYEYASGKYYEYYIKYRQKKEC